MEVLNACGQSASDYLESKMPLMKRYVMAEMVRHPCWSAATAFTCSHPQMEQSELHHR